MRELMLLLILSYAVSVECSKRCFECTDHPSPSDCRTVIECPDSYECYVSKFITSGGLVLYNSGCHSTERCQQLSGRRSDLLVCEECCDRELCNNAGCGATVPARGDRGPYCFSCDSQADPASCRDIERCDREEFCSIKYDVQTQHYVTGCILNNQCTYLQNQLLNLVGKRTPSSADMFCSCCSDDFCNDNCTLGKPATTTGSWSDWSTWTACSATCGQGQRSRTRQCQNGNGCVGDTSVLEQCYSSGSCHSTTGKPTTVTGSWSDWSTWTACSATCGQGQRSRTRQCQHGIGCVGDTSVLEQCYASGSCDSTTGSPVGYWLSWGSWSSCTSTCGQGQRFRLRQCNDSQTCIGDDIMADKCTSSASCVQTTGKPAITRGNWSDWSIWTACSAPCGQGQRSRTRQCQNGTGCVGDTLVQEQCTASGSCDTTTVSSNSIWEQWTTWSSCSHTCGTGTRSRTRVCLSGACTGPNVESTKCTTQTDCNHIHYFTEDHCRAKDFDSFTIDGHVGCLKLMFVKDNWYEARSMCHKLGAELFTVDNSKKQEALEKYLSQRHAYGAPFIWLGLSNHNHEWMWVGRPPYPLTSYNNFADHHALSQHGCGIITMTRNASLWHKDICSNLHDVVCELVK